MKRVALLFSLIAIIASCKKGENEEPLAPREVFKFQLADGHAEDVDYWVIVKISDTGELIGAKQIEPGQAVEFISDKRIANDLLAITFFTHDPLNTRASVYTNVAVGSNWTYQYTLGPTPGGPGSSIGTYDLKVTNIPSLYAFHVSDKFGGTLNSALSGTTVTGKFRIHQNAATHFVSVHSGTANPKYTTIDVKPGDNIALDFGDLKEFDKFLNVTFPKSLADVVVKGYEGTYNPYNAFVIYNNDFGGGSTRERTDINLGFLNSFPNYKIDVTVGKNFFYSSLGPIPLSIKHVDKSVITIESPTLLKYSITSGVAYEYRVAIYANSITSFGVAYYGQHGTVHQDALTPEIIGQYSLDMSSLSYRRSEVIVSGQTYSQLLDSKFSTSHNPGAPYEIVKISDDK